MQLPRNRPFLCKAAGVLLTWKNTEAIPWRQAGWSSFTAFRTSFLMVRVLLRWFWVLGKNPTLQTPSLTLFFGLTMSYLSGRLSEIEGHFWGICLRFSADRNDVITGKYPTTLKSVCSPWTLVKFIASLRQIAVNEIAAFWLDTDGKKFVLKKIIAAIHHNFF